MRPVGENFSSNAHCIPQCNASLFLLHGASPARLCFANVSLEVAIIADQASTSVEDTCEAHHDEQLGDIGNQFSCVSR